MNTFRAQTLCESHITEDQTRFELTFVDAVGHKHKLNIPVPLAGDLIKVLGTVASCAPPDSGNFTRLPHEFAVGHAVAERMVLLRFDKEPPMRSESRQLNCLCTNFKRRSSMSLCCVARQCTSGKPSGCSGAAILRPRTSIYVFARAPTHMGLNTSPGSAN